MTKQFYWLDKNYCFIQYIETLIVVALRYRHWMIYVHNTSYSHVQFSVALHLQVQSICLPAVAVDCCGCGQALLTSSGEVEETGRLWEVFKCSLSWVLSTCPILSLPDDRKHFRLGVRLFFAWNNERTELRWRETAVFVLKMYKRIQCQIKRPPTIWNKRTLLEKIKTVVG